MSLKLVLKPGEPLYVGEAEIRIMSSANCIVLVDGPLPILRSKDALADAGDADPVSRLRLVLQNIYLSNKPEFHYRAYMETVIDVLAAQPERAAAIRQINRAFEEGNIYRAVRLAVALSRSENRENRPVAPAMAPLSASQQ